MVYDRIKEICEQRSLSISALEKEAGLSNGAISKWNNCSPRTNSLLAVAKALGVEVSDLLTPKEED